VPFSLYIIKVCGLSLFCSHFYSGSMITKSAGRPTQKDVPGALGKSPIDATIITEVARNDPEPLLGNDIASPAASESSSQHHLSTGRLLIIHIGCAILYVHRNISLMQVDSQSCSNTLLGNYRRGTFEA